MTGFRTVSQRSAGLSRNQQQQIQLNKNLRLMRNPDFLRVQVNETLARQKKEVIKPHKEWTVVHTSKGTPFLGDCFTR